MPGFTLHAPPSQQEPIIESPTTPNSPDAPAEERIDWPKLFPWLLVAVGTLVYLNTLGNEFVFDDTAHIRAERIRPLSEWATILTESRRGLANLTLAVNWAIDGDQPRGYHLVNIVIHVLAAVTLYGLARRLLWARLRDTTQVMRMPRLHEWLACAIALLWLVHPLNTQAVTYVIQRHESLMGLFYLLTLYGVARAAEGVRIAGFAAILAGAAGMMSKEVMVTAPVVALLMDRTFFAGSFARALSRRWWLYLGFVAAFAAVGAMWFQKGLLNLGGGDTPAAGFGVQLVNWWQYLLSQGEVILHYLRLAFWPDPLVLDYRWLPAWLVVQQHPDRMFVEIVLPVAAVAVLLLASLVGVFRNTWWGFVGFTFFAVLSVTSSVIPIADVAFEHRMYLPLVCVVALVVVAGWWVLRRMLPIARPAMVGGAATLIVATVLALLTVQRNQEYATAVSIWATVTERAPLNPRGWHNLGEGLQREGRVQEAILAYDRALEIYPGHGDTHRNLATAHLALARPDLALPHARQAVQDEPDDTEARYALAQSLLELGEFDAALLQLQEAIDREPEMAKAWDLRGTVLVQQNKLEEAIASFRRAVETDPTLADAYYNLGLTLRDTGRYRAAADAFDAALRLDPENPRYLRAFARMLATTPQDDVRNGATAIQLAAQASVLLQNRDLPTLDTLAAAHAAAEQWDQAISVQQHVIALAEQATLPNMLVDQMRERLDLYQARQPYREGPAPREEEGGE